MLKFLASRSYRKKFCGYRETARKPDAGWLVRERIVTSSLEKSSGRLNCFSFLTGHGIKAKSTNCNSAILICLSVLFHPISELIHLARRVKFNP